MKKKQTATDKLTEVVDRLQATSRAIGLPPKKVWSIAHKTMTEQVNAELNRRDVNRRAAPKRGSHSHIDFHALWKAKCRAWKCKPIIIWDDNWTVYPQGLAVTKKGQVFFINAKGARKVTLAESLRLLLRIDPTQSGYTHGEAFYKWFRLIEQALR